MRDRLLQSYGKWLANMPMWMIRLFGYIVGRRMLSANVHEVRVARVNMAFALRDLTPKEREQSLKKGIIEANKTLLEMPRVWQMEQEEIKRAVVKQNGFDLFRRAKMFGKGVIVGVPYMGNWEFMARFITTLDANCGVSDAFPLEGYEREVWHGRSLSNIPLLGLNQEAEFVSLLQQGGIACLFSDVVPPESEGVYAPLFNVAVATSTQIAQLGRKSGAVIVFAFAERINNGRGYEVNWILGPEEIYDADPIISGKAINRAVRACMRRNPVQYFWSHKRLARCLDGSNPYAGL